MAIIPSRDYTTGHDLRSLVAQLGRQALHIAAQKDRVDIVKLLMELKPEIEAKDNVRTQPSFVRQ